MSSSFAAWRRVDVTVVGAVVEDRWEVNAPCSAELNCCPVRLYLDPRVLHDVTTALLPRGGGVHLTGSYL